MENRDMKGFLFKGMAAGIKKDGSPDLGIIYSRRPAEAAALFTRNRVVAAPVVLGRERMKSGLCQAIVVNSGNANCFTGEQGIKDARKTAEMTAGLLGIPQELVMVSSTGVIGAPLPMDLFKAALPRLVEDLSEDGLEDFATAILTTDTDMKISSHTCTIHGSSFSIVGVAKGSGMIRPDMATMLAYVLTDLDIPARILKSFLQKGCDRTFNRITVDGDTSTNDTLVALANGMSQVALEDSDDSLEFQCCLDRVLMDLAEAVVRDGEGATKMARINVRGALTREDAYLVAQAVSHSNLVKTAIYGEDPNWGRVVAAAGRSGAVVEPEKIGLYFDEVCLVKDGRWLGPDAEKEAARVMKQPEMTIGLDLNLGEFQDTYLFCDFSEDYVKINADYRS